MEDMHNTKAIKMTIACSETLQTSRIPTLQKSDYSRGVKKKKKHLKQKK